MANGPVSGFVGAQVARELLARRNNPPSLWTSVPAAFMAVHAGRGFPVPDSMAFKFAHLPPWVADFSPEVFFALHPGELTFSVLAVLAYGLVIALGARRRLVGEAATPLLVVCLLSFTLQGWLAGILVLGMWQLALQHMPAPSAPDAEETAESSDSAVLEAAVGGLVVFAAALFARWIFDETIYGFWPVAGIALVAALALGLVERWIARYLYFNPHPPGWGKEDADKP